VSRKSVAIQNAPTGHWESCHADCSGNKQKTLHLQCLRDRRGYIRTKNVGVELTLECTQYNQRNDYPEAFRGIRLLPESSIAN
jgi:hypothetical protein